MTERRRRRKKTFGLEFVVAGVAAAGAIAMQWSRLDRVTRYTLDPAVAEERSAIQLELLDRLPTLGFDNAIADWVFLQYLQYFGDEAARIQTGCNLSEQYFDLVTRRDPRFLIPYIFVPSSVAYCQGKPERSVELLDRGIAAISPQIHENAFILPLLQGLDQFLLLNDIDGAIESYELAAVWVEETRFAVYANSLRDIARYLREDPDSIQARFFGWSEVYRNAVDDRVRARAITELEKLGARLEQQPNGEFRFVLPESPTN